MLQPYSSVVLAQKITHLDSFEAQDRRLAARAGDAIMNPARFIYHQAIEVALSELRETGYSLAWNNESMQYEIYVEGAPGTWHT